MNINSVSIQGTVTKEPEHKAINDQWNIMKFAIAVNSWKKTDAGWQQGDAEFFDVVHWYKKVTQVLGRVAKGKSVVICGKLKQEQWTDQQTQQRRSRVVISADSIAIIEKEQRKETEGVQQQTVAAAQSRYDNGTWNPPEVDGPPF